MTDIDKSERPHENGSTDCGRRSAVCSLFKSAQKRLCQELIESSAVATFVVDNQHQIILWNTACEELTGVKGSELIGTDEQWRPFYDTVRPVLADIVIDDSSGEMSKYYSVYSDTLMRGGLRAEGWYPNLNGKKRYLRFSAAPIRNDDGKVIAAIETLHEITDHNSVAALAQEQKEFAENLVQNSAVPTFVISAQREVLIWNRACKELTGVDGEVMLGKCEAWKAFYDQKRPVLAEMVIDGAAEHILESYSILGKSSFIPEGLQAEAWFQNLNGRERYLFFSAAPIRKADGELVAVIETLEDITERKQYEKQLEYLANHDGLTGLPNRNLLTDRISQALLISRRNERQMAVIYVNLDHFKFINDALGYELGDELLKSVAQRLTGSLRASDTVARHGGDEFIVVAANLAAADHAVLVAEKIRQELSRPFIIVAQELVVTCSIGIAVAPEDGDDVATLIRNSCAAMYRAKQRGRDNFQYYAREMNERSLSRMTMETHLRRALERNELFLHYQPKLCLRTGLVTGMEALLRWQSPELGVVSPDSFIPVAEATGLIETIGAWVLKTACAQTRAWQRDGLPALTVAVNLSARQFRLKNLAAVIAEVLQETGLEPHYLELEITESMVMQNVDRVSVILKRLKEMGICLSMDDFGTGYSSLSYLKQFPFDSLKIDQSFVKDITSNKGSAAIVRTVIAMAHSLNLKAIAEGVETEGQLDYLRAHDCDEVQGYYFSRPVPPEAFIGLL